jgi:hypothetical protein
MGKQKQGEELKGLIDLGWFGELPADEADSDDANREMGLPEGEDWGNK